MRPTSIKNGPGANHNTEADEHVHHIGSPHFTTFREYCPMRACLITVAENLTILAGLTLAAIIWFALISVAVGVMR